MAIFGAFGRGRRKSNRTGIIVGPFTLFLLLALVLWGLTPTVVQAHPPILYSISPVDDILRTVNPNTAATTSSIPIILAGETVRGGTGLARDPTTGLLWALLKTQSQTGRELVTIDPVTGVATSMGNTGLADDQKGENRPTGFAGITFLSDGTLYAVTGDGGSPAETLFTLNKNNATPAFILTLGNGDDGETIAYNPEDGLIYHASGHGTQNVVTSGEILETINPGNLAVNNVALSGVDYNEALALVDNGSSFLLADGPRILQSASDLYTVTDDGVVSLIGGMDHTAKGLAFLGDEHPVSVGGMTSFLTSSSDSSSDGIPLLVGSVSAAVAIAAAGGWYTRRRWYGAWFH